MKGYLQFKNVVDYEGLYVVNRNGDVVSLQRTYTDSNGVTRTNKKYTLKPDSTMKDCPRVTLTKNGISTKHKCFELADEAFKDIE
jgi:hypothetical protein